MPRKSAYDWSAVDWSLPTKEIAKRIGCSAGLVSTARSKHAPETSLKPVTHSRHCVICGAAFVCSPSSNNSTCSPACRSERTRRQALGGRPWGFNAKARLATKGQTDNLTLGTPAAWLSPIAGPFITNQEAKIWQVIAPDGIPRTIRNMRRTLINELGETEGIRVERILTRMAFVMRHGGDAWTTRCGWTLTAAPKYPEQDTGCNAIRGVVRED